MVSTKWFQGIENIETCMELRRKVFCEELKLDENSIKDAYDDFAFNVVVYEDDNPVGTGRLLFKDGRYFIDKICVLEEFRSRNYGNLIIRMLVRKAVTIGAKQTYSCVDEKHIGLFEKVGFVKSAREESRCIIMVKEGDVGGC